MRNVIAPEVVGENVIAPEVVGEICKTKNTRKNKRAKCKQAKLVNAKRLGKQKFLANGKLAD